MRSNSANLRKNVRANIHIPLILRGTDREGRPFSILGRSMDFSRKGLGVLLDRDIVMPGSVLSVSSEHGFKSNATVQWISRDKATDLYHIGLRLIEPKTTVLIKIAASVILLWAFMHQLSFAGSREFARGAPTRSGTVCAQSAGPVEASPAAWTKETQHVLGFTEAQAAEQKSDESESDPAYWVREAFLAAPESGTGEGLTELDIRMSKDRYGAGETIAASEYRLSNPSQHSRSVEIKTWLASPGAAPISVGNVGADGQYILEPGADEQYGPVQLTSVSENLPSGNYEFSARVLDPVTGEVLGEKVRPFSLAARLERARQIAREDAPSLDVSFQFGRADYTYGDTVSLSHFRIANVTPAKATLELKVWLEIPGKSPIAVFSLGADGSLVLTPGADMNLVPLREFKVTSDLPAGTYQLKCKAMDPATGETFYENASSFDVR